MERAKLSRSTLQSAVAVLKQELPQIDDVFLGEALDARLEREQAKAPAGAGRPPPEKLLTTAEVAEVLQTSERTVQRLASRGLLAPVRVSDRLVRYAPSDIAAHIRACASLRDDASGALPRNEG